MRAFFLTTIVFFVAAAPGFGWGCDGHQIVALIARAHLTPAASAAVTQLLARNPIDPALNRFCRERPSDPMVDAASWADDVKTAQKAGAWHYVDLPLTEESGTDLAPVCPPVGPSVDGKDRPGCLVNALEYQWAILLDTTRSDPDRAMALRYVIHLVGDFHQPLHDSNNADGGGNCTVMRFFDEERTTNLHTIWDSRLITHELTLKQEKQVDYAAALDRQFADRWLVWGTPAIDPLAWAWEGNKLARNLVYQNLKPQIGFAKPGVVRECDAERAIVSALHISIGKEYFDQAIPVIGEQLAKAGYRLADLLNRAF